MRAECRRGSRQEFETHRGTPHFKIQSPCCSLLVSNGLFNVASLSPCSSRSLSLCLTFSFAPPPPLLVFFSILKFFMTQKSAVIIKSSLWI